MYVYLIFMHSLQLGMLAVFFFFFFFFFFCNEIFIKDKCACMLVDFYINWY